MSDRFQNESQENIVVNDFFFLLMNKYMDKKFDLMIKINAHSYDTLII